MIRSDGAGSKDELRTPFVEQRTYRRRRLMDVARLAPLIGALLFLVPLLWPRADGPSTGGAATSMSTAMVYIFSVWVGLIVFSFCFSLAVRRWAVHWTGGPGTVELVDPPSDRRVVAERPVLAGRADSSPASGAEATPAKDTPEAGAGG